MGFSTEYYILILFIRNNYMKCIIDKKEITDVLSKMQGITSRKSSLVITENVLIKTDQDKIILSATDLETGFEGVYSATIEKEGAIAVSAQKLNEIVRMFPNDQILIEEKENRWIEITSEKLNYHLIGMNPEEFPEIPRVDETPFIKIDSACFKRMIESSIIISVPGSEKREHMIGVSLERISEEGENLIRLVSTDTRRLSKIDYVCDSSSWFQQGEGIIIPKKGLSEVNKFLEPEGMVEIGVKGNHFIVKKDNETLIINLLFGTFPEYADLLRIEEEFDVAFNKDLLLMMLKRMAIVTSEEYRGVNFRLENNELIIKAVNPTVGESMEKIEIIYQREPIEAAFNPKYFIEALGFIKGDTVLLNIKDRELPCKIRDKNKNDTNYLNVIMPMKI